MNPRGLKGHCSSMPMMEFFYLRAALLFFLASQSEFPLVVFNNLLEKMWCWERLRSACSDFHGSFLEGLLCPIPIWSRFGLKLPRNGRETSLKHHLLHSFVYSELDPDHWNNTNQSRWQATVECLNTLFSCNSNGTINNALVRDTSDGLCTHLCDKTCFDRIHWNHNANRGGTCNAPHSGVFNVSSRSVRYLIPGAFDLLKERPRQSVARDFARNACKPASVESNHSSIFVQS
mmetsp:Transcript_78949/g.229283  ORF Transcript_78949/g.229283 Transcript_78949/m.229283 type:complete len:233 (-) Transcript_78949:1153-1851(-)